MVFSEHDANFYALDSQVWIPPLSMPHISTSNMYIHNIYIYILCVFGHT